MPASVWTELCPLSRGRRTRAGLYPVGSQVPGAAAAHSERSQAVLPTGPPSLGGGGGYLAVVILFVSGLFAVGAFILYKFKRQGRLASLGSQGMWAGPEGHGGRGLCP